MEYKHPKFAGPQKAKKIRLAMEKYRGTIKLLQKKLVLAMKSYKQAVEEERAVLAKKRMK